MNNVNATIVGAIAGDGGTGSGNSVNNNSASEDRGGAAAAAVTGLIIIVMVAPSAEITLPVTTCNLLLIRRSRASIRTV